MHQDSSPDAKGGVLLLLAWIGGCTLLILAWQILTSVEFLRIVLWPFTPLLARMQTGEIGDLTAVVILMGLGCVVGTVVGVVGGIWPNVTRHFTRHQSR